MKISLIIPTRNRIDYLEMCISSIETQIEKPFEIIIIIHKDDELSKKFIENYSTNLNIKYYETDGGSCKSRNLAIKKASGDILAFLDDDVILHENYIKNLTKIFDDPKNRVIAGYTFDLGVLTTPWYLHKGELEYIYRHQDELFFQKIKDEILKRTDGQIKVDPEFINSTKFFLYRISGLLRNLLKIVIIQEGIRKGKILASGYRSASPDTSQIDALKKVEWFSSCNFAVRKEIINEFFFNEKLELLPYALCEDLELSARIIKKYDIFIAKNVMVFHLGAPTGIKINSKERFKSMIINYHRVALLKGNEFAYWWSVGGLLISRIIKIPFSYKTTISELKGIFEGINYLKSIK